MIVEIGHFAMILALGVAVAQSTVPMIGAARNDRAWMAVASPTATAQLGLLTISFLALTYAYVTSLEISVVSVVQIPTSFLYDKDEIYHVHLLMS